MGKRSENKRNCQNIIREYIKEHKKNKTKIRSLKRMFEDIKSKEADGLLEFHISLQTFYRYANEMDLQEISPGSQQFDFIIDRPAPFNTYLFRKDFNNFICYKLKASTLAYGSLITKYINDYYSHYKNSFHCALLDDMIICFFYTSPDNDDKDSKGKNNSPVSLSKSEVIKDIRRCLKKFTITEVK